MSSWEEDLVRGKQKLPPRICIYGDHGIGKSTFSSKFPSPIFLNTEDGLEALDVVSFPLATSTAEITDNIRTLIRQEHSYKTVVLDTADWLVEPIITGDVERGKTEKELGYGRGAILVSEEFRMILQGLDALRKKKGMNVLITAHATITRFENPQTEPYDRYRPKLPKRCNELLQEWVDVMAFAAYQVIIKQTEVGFNKKVARGATNGERLLHLVETPAFVAKNRYEGGPDVISMKMEELSKIIPIFGL